MDNSARSELAGISHNPGNNAFERIESNLSNYSITSDSSSMLASSSDQHTIGAAMDKISEYDYLL